MVEQEAGKKARRDEAEARLRVEHEEGQHRRADAVGGNARADPRRQKEDQQQGKRCPADAVEEHGEGERARALAEVRRRRQDERQVDRHRQRESRPQARGQHIGHHRRESEDEQADAGRHRRAEAPREPEADRRQPVRHRAHRSVEVAMRHLPGHDPMRPVEEHHEVVEVAGRDGLAGRGEEQGRDDGNRDDPTRRRARRAPTQRLAPVPTQHRPHTPTHRSYYDERT